MVLLRLCAGSIAYRSGVATGVATPLSAGLLGGISAAFNVGSAHKLEKGALLSDAVAVHVSIGHSASLDSISTQIAVLRNLLLEDESPLSEVTNVSNFFSCPSPALILRFRAIRHW